MKLEASIHHGVDAGEDYILSDLFFIFLKRELDISGVLGYNTRTLKVYSFVERFMRMNMECLLLFHSCLFSFLLLLPRADSSALAMF